ncbi:MAG: helix-turn-helix transcriptional regulator [Anaerolineales bacterium]|jgi:putative transcriptional regulator
MSHRTVANRVKELRTGLDLTQADLADQVGIARVSILAIEKGRFIPTIETALRISQALGAAVEDIFWLKDESNED